MSNKRYTELVKNIKNDNNNVFAYIYKNPSKDSFNENEMIFTIKDNYATIDAPTQASSKFLEGFMPGYDSEIVKKIRKSNGVIVAKTHLDEFGLGGSGEFSAYGKIVHPLDSKRMISGSSSGAAASMFYDVDVAIGSDTGDSVRYPASINGFVGFKPSFGAVSRYGLFAFASSLDTVS
jgi:aspartyl-tRNA(Asn)/glutamyl-tRNA(Gln) amidotransferase subunit A